LIKKLKKLKKKGGLLSHPLGHHGVADHPHFGQGDGRPPPGQKNKNSGRLVLPSATPKGKTDLAEFFFFFLSKGWLNHPQEPLLFF
jgi:hypothetical protein